MGKALPKLIYHSLWYELENLMLGYILNNS